MDVYNRSNSMQIAVTEPNNRELNKLKTKKIKNKKNC